jgi:hypothetical protein
MDKTFRTRIGGPLGTVLPASLLCPTDSSSEDVSDEVEEDDGMQAAAENISESDEDTSSKFLEIERHIFSAIAPHFVGLGNNVSIANSSKATSPSASVVFSKELLMKVRLLIDF